MACKIEPITPDRLTGVPTNETPWDHLDERTLTGRRHKEGGYACARTG
jgi:hypothetical protein